MSREVEREIKAVMIGEYRRLWQQGLTGPVFDRVERKPIEDVTFRGLDHFYVEHLKILIERFGNTEN